MSSGIGGFLCKITPVSRPATMRVGTLLNDAIMMFHPLTSHEANEAIQCIKQEHFVSARVLVQNVCRGKGLT